jgi:hypothetical protein
MENAKIKFDTHFFFGLRFLFKPKPDPVTFLIFFFVAIFCFTKTIFENIAYRLFQLFIKYIGYYIAPVFKASFPTAFAPEYNRGLTKGKSPLKKDTIPLPLCTLKTLQASRFF